MHIQYSFLSLLIANFRYGFFTQKAQQYKMNYSFPTTNHTYPVPLIDRRNSSVSGPSTNKPKTKDEDPLNEEFV